MQHDWNTVSLYQTGEKLQHSGAHNGHDIFASYRSRHNFGWLLDKIPSWSGCTIHFLTDLDITNGIDPATLSDDELRSKINNFIAQSPSLFNSFSEESLNYFRRSAEVFVRYGNEAAQGFRLRGGERFTNMLFIKDITTRDHAHESQQGLGCAIPISAFDDAAMTIMHECAHLKKLHSHMNTVEAFINENEAEKLVELSFNDALNEGYNLNPESLAARQAYRAIQSMIVNNKHINRYLHDDGFAHTMSAAGALTDERLNRTQAEALLKTPMHINTVLDQLLDNEQHVSRPHYFSALPVLNEQGHFGNGSLANVYVNLALQACAQYAPEWLNKDLIADFTEKLGSTNLTLHEWASTESLFGAKSQYQNLAPSKACALET